jgi:hypothetical protein
MLEIAVNLSRLIRIIMKLSMEFMLNLTFMATGMMTMSLKAGQKEKVPLLKAKS